MPLQETQQDENDFATKTRNSNEIRTRCAFGVPMILNTNNGTTSVCTSIWDDLGPFNHVREANAHVLSRTALKICEIGTKPDSMEREKGGLGVHLQKNTKCCN